MSKNTDLVKMWLTHPQYSHHFNFEKNQLLNDAITMSEIAAIDEIIALEMLKLLTRHANIVVKSADTMTTTKKSTKADTTTNGPTLTTTPLHVCVLS